MAAYNLSMFAADPSQVLAPAGMPGASGALAPLPFPVGPLPMVAPLPHHVHVMAPPSLHDVPPPIMGLHLPQAGAMMTQPPLPVGPPPTMVLQTPHASSMLAQPPLPATPPWLKRQGPDYFDMPFVPHITERKQENAGAIVSPYEPYLHDRVT